MHPGQPGVVTRAEEFGQGDFVGVALGHNLQCQFGDVVSVESGTHQATIENVAAVDASRSVLVWC
jgi:hypothetical protein